LERQKRLRSKDGSNLSNLAGSSKPNEQKEDKIGEKVRDKGPEIILGSIEDISGRGQGRIFLDLLLFFC
jgi:hypothetical protein